MLGLLSGAFYYCDENLIPKLTPMYHCEENIDSVEDRIPALTEITDDDIPYRTEIDRLEGGAMSSYSVIAMGTSVDLLLEIGIDNLFSHVRELETHYRNLINERELPVEWVGSNVPDRWSGNICLYFDIEKAEQLKEKCAEKDIHVTVKRVRGKGFLRIAPHYYNTKEHMERLVNVLKEVL